MYWFLVLPKARSELETWRPWQLHAWSALACERLLSPRCGTREPAAPQLLKGRFRGERQFLDSLLGGKDCAVRNDTLCIQNPYRLRRNLAVSWRLGQADRPFRPVNTNQPTVKGFCSKTYLYVDSRNAELRRPSYLT